MSRRMKARCPLGLEVLEGRTLPATWVWDGGVDPNDFNWSSPANWGPMDGVPQPADEVIFNGTSTKNSIVDVGFHGTVAKLTIEGSYTGGLKLNRDLTVTQLGKQQGGLIHGQSALVIPTGGHFEWEAGPQEDGETRIEGNATMEIKGAGEKLLFGRRLTNRGVITWTGGGQIRLAEGGSAAVISNQGMQARFIVAPTANGTIWDTDQPANKFIVGTGATLECHRDTDMRVHFTNDGTVLVADTKELRLKRDSTSQGAYSLGTSGAVELLSEGAARTHTLNNAIVNGGVLALQALFAAHPTTLNVLGNTTVARFEQTGPSFLEGSGTLRITSAYDWFGGEWWGTGQTQIDANAILDCSFLPLDNTLVLDQRKLVNNGTVLWRNGVDFFLKNGASIANNANAIFDIKNDRNILDGGAAGKFENRGILRKTGGSGETRVDVDYEQIGPAAQRKLKDGTTIRFTKGNRQLGGVTDLQGGTLASTQPTEILGGSLTGVGTIIGNLLMAGEFHVGGDGAIGTVTVTGNYEQTVSGMVIIEMNSPTSNDVLSIGGTATLAGTLYQSMIDGYEAEPLEDWDIIFWGGYTGSFNPPPEAWIHQYNGGGLILIYDPPV